MEREETVGADGFLHCSICGEAVEREINMPFQDGPDGQRKRVRCVCRCQREEKEAYEHMASELDEYWVLDSDILALGGDIHSEENRAQAQTKAANELAPLFTEVYGDLTELMEVNVDKGNDLASALQILTIVIIIIIIIIIAAVMFVSIKIGRSIARQMSNALNVVSERMKKFAKGDLSSDFPEFEIKDEINDLALEIKAMAKDLSQIIYVTE